MCFINNNVPCHIEKKCKLCFDASFASHEKVKFWSNRNIIYPSQIKQQSNKKFWFNCDKSNHVFESSLNNIVHGKWCPYPCCCSGRQGKLCTDDCETCHKASFVSHEKANLWSNKNELNPRQIFKNSSKKYWFRCDKSDHEFETTLNHIISGTWCPYPCCAKPSRILCRDINCKICLEASFASHEKAEYWSDKNELNPREVLKNSHTKYLFKCDKSNHEFDAILSSITKGNWCPYPCCGSKRICFEKCEICYIASFESHDKAQYWSDENKVTPREIYKSSGKKYWFKCENQHEFESMLCNITKGQWCPECYRWKNEKECIDYIEKLTNKLFKKSYPNYLNGLELDGYNEEMMLAIEYNGEQHYEYNDFFHKGNKENLTKQQERDKLKNELCHQNGIFLITIPYNIKDKEDFINKEYTKYLGLNPNHS
jgi:hypothetical protein